MTQTGTPAATEAAPQAQERLAPSTRRTYAILVGLTTLSVLVQAVTAGLFVNQKGDSADSWTDVHGLIAYPVMVLALITAIYSFAAMRRTVPRCGRGRRCCSSRPSGSGSPATRSRPCTWTG